MTMTSQERAEQNRRNAQKSTGPRSQEGKDRSRFNAVKHGIRAKLPVLPGENPAAYQARLDGWVGSLQPVNEVELFLVQRAVHVSWQLDRADRVEALRLNDRLAAEAERLARTIATQGERLFRAPGGSIDLFPVREGQGAHGPISWPSHRGHDDHPERLIASLETTAAGCSWLLERWRALGRALDDGCWQASDRLRAVRLLGCQPCDLVTEPKVWTIYVACESIEPGRIDLDREVLDDFTTPALAPLSGRILRRFRKAVETRKHRGDDGRADLRALVDSAIKRLEDLLADRNARQEEGLSPTMARVGFDETGAGEALRRHQAACDRSLSRTLETLRKVRKHGVSMNADDTDPLDSEPPSSGPDQNGEIATSASAAASPDCVEGTVSRGDAENAEREINNQEPRDADAEDSSAPRPPRLRVSHSSSCARLDGLMEADPESTPEGGLPEPRPQDVTNEADSPAAPASPFKIPLAAFLVPWLFLGAGAGWVTSSPGLASNRPAAHEAPDRRAARLDDVGDRRTADRSSPGFDPLRGDRMIRLMDFPRGRCRQGSGKCEEKAGPAAHRDCWRGPSPSKTALDVPAASLYCMRQPDAGMQRQWNATSMRYQGKWYCPSRSHPLPVEPRPRRVGRRVPISPSHFLASARPQAPCSIASSGFPSAPV